MVCTTGGILFVEDIIRSCMTCIRVFIIRGVINATHHSCEGTEIITFNEYTYYFSFILISKSPLFAERRLLN